MKILPTTEDVTKIEADAIVVGLYEDASPSGPAAAVDKATGGVLTRLLESKEISGKNAKATALLAPTGIAAGQVVVVGLGSRENFQHQQAYRAAGAAIKLLAGKKRARVALFLDDALPSESLQGVVVGAMVGCVGQDLYRAEKNQHPVGEILISGEKSDIERGRILGESVNLTRRLVNEPPSHIYPESFASECVALANDASLDCEVWNEKRLKKEKCGSLLAVARGSANPPRLVILRHKGAGADAPTLALVGKGVTFDSGGLSLKPSDGMKTMKCDMAGAATVVGAMRAIGLLKLPVNVIGMVGLVENMLGADCYKLGDVLTARNGKTIEVLNTDAEGRLVLADVLDVAVTSGASKIVDLATLTGACVVALGEDIAGLMTNDEAWCKTIADAAKDCGEQAWELPMGDEFAEQIKSSVADIKNIGSGRWGGAMTAAKFLEEFVGDTPWTHIDIAGPAFLEKAKSWQDAGGSGAFVRTLVELARRWS